MAYNLVTDRQGLSEAVRYSYERYAELTREFSMTTNQHRLDALQEKFDEVPNYPVLRSALNLLGKPEMITND